MQPRKKPEAPSGKRPANASRPKDPLDALHAFDRLEVGPVEVRRDRLTAPYAVVRGRAKDSIDLVYRFEEPVFDPKSPSDRNLASMAAAQVALNYGLFCREIVFRGAFDETDRRFLAEMAENTAREIYVKKFLEPNPFLVGAGLGIPALPRENYLRASLLFPDAEPAGKISWRIDSADRNRCAVLSSGGKDSLLTYGLLNELGYEVHPIFGNESGRHWFTALNAFRHFQKNVPHTARVWMNSDRLFSWMLRRLPFIRADFASVRSDEYPIRLWTVAVFLFGALPLARARRAGRILIGDEYDTTVRASHKGIEHYDGLFDQSRFFDNALSRYYGRKGWALSQFSVLRPLSELLIEKTLYERYPALVEQQVSCHATHIEGGRVFPCGRCEKCRRIVGMILAVGGDPGLLGYKPEQIETCLADLPLKGAHQEEASLHMALRLLEKRGRISLTPRERKRVRSRPEALQLRFDPIRSPIEGIPIEMRIPLYRILLEHAEGAVRRKGRAWEAFDPTTDVAANRAFPFERDTGDSFARGSARGERPARFLLGELTWPEARERLGEVDVALLPVGAIEQHGPHLPLDTDAFDAEHLCREVAMRCQDPKPLVLPLIPYGVSYHHADFPGTVSIGNDTLARLVYEIGMALAANGVTKLLIINGHGGNKPALDFAAQMINRDARVFVGVDTGETSDVDIYGMTETPNDVHAGEVETSTSLATRPHLVDSGRIEKLVPSFSSRYLNFTSRRGVSWHAFTKRISPSGVMGDPTKASAEKGVKMWEAMIGHLVELVEDLKALTLDEIYQRRY
ncbi:MAG: creatininase family protein [Candidatus Eisenbacteria bacterium]|nr:creatininase family protein [Candidatus Eisenbacteria bacterium]